MQVTKQYRTETAHRLLNHKGLCRFIHGHSYLWEITVTDLLNKDGMVIDFKDLKKVIKTVLEPFDHALVLSSRDPFLNDMAKRSDSYNTILDRTINFNGSPTAENFAKYAAEILRGVHNLNVVRVRVWETVDSYADWEG